MEQQISQAPAQAQAEAAPAAPEAQAAPAAAQAAASVEEAFGMPAQESPAPSVPPAQDTPSPENPPEAPAAEPGSQAAPATAPATALDALAAPPAEQDGAPAEATAESAPLTEWTPDTVSLPQGVELPPGVLDRFGELAVNAGLTREQAQRLVDFELGAARDIRDARMEQGRQALADAWGVNAQRNCEQVVSLMARMERVTGSDAFARAMRDSGALNSPAVIMGLHAIAGMLAEDSIGTSGQAAPAGPESPIQGIEAVFAQARKNRAGGYF